MNQRTRERIAREETDRFLDSNFGGLDLTGFPDLNNPPLERFEEADRHGFIRVDTSGLGSVNRLRELIENPTPDVETNVMFGHKIPLGETYAYAAAPALSASFTAKCDECGKEYSYEPDEVMRFELELPASFKPHPLFQ